MTENVFVYTFQQRGRISKGARPKFKFESWEEMLLFLALNGKEKGERYLVSDDLYVALPDGFVKYCDWGKNYEREFGSGNR